MIVVDHLEEGLDAIASGTLLLAHSLGDRSWVSVDAGHQRVSVALGIGALVLVLQDDSLTTGILALKQQDHLAGFHNLAHDGSKLSGTSSKKDTNSSCGRKREPEESTGGQQEKRGGSSHNIFRGIRRGRLNPV